ncbi:hypothetical protein EZJ19_11565 [Parasulfuritortus cantonensis]|uniref:Uncharacterized protein n=1 Tax=Parasulfuritortus cantonensis TaxID=2528202 RepID=A0A4R1B7C4_9PROT|nr:hypothetical protein [Parasulfuritortus cantonensis]TCJ12867.1 hypothetical protein EZJ19_11565 [Parasulfuritortus cantonensis]
MKKKFILAMFAVSILVTSTANASGATLCPIYEFAELQTMTNEELKEAWSNDLSQIMRSNAYELENCKTQMGRIERVRILKGYLVKGEDGKLHEPNR